MAIDFLVKCTQVLNVFLKSGKPLTSMFRKGASVASIQINYSLKQYVPVINTIIDVGANQGQFALAAAYFFPDAIIHSFEPVPNTFGILAKNTQKVSAIKVYNFALGSNDGEIDFYSNEYSHASSALPVSKLQKDILPKTSVEHKIKVPVKKLENVVINEIELKGKVLLKLDVQGFEKEVLKGCGSIASKIDYLLFEASFVSMYDGEALFDEMHSLVKEMGFELIGPVGTLQSDKMQILQMDILYKRIDK